MRSTAISTLPRSSARSPLFRRILVAVDASPTAWNAVRVAVRLAQREAGAELAFVHAIDLNWALVERSLDDITLVVEEHRETARLVLRSAQAAADGAGIVSTPFTRDGPPADVIPELAEQIGADLVVVGDSTHGKLHRVLHGSARDGLLASRVRPLLIVREHQWSDGFAPRCIAVILAGGAIPYGTLRFASALAVANDARLILAGTPEMPSFLVREEIASIVRRPLDVRTVTAKSVLGSLDAALAQHAPQAVVVGAAAAQPWRKLLPLPQGLGERVLAYVDLPVFVTHA